MKMSDISIHAFLQEYGIRNEGGQPLDFKDHPFLFDVYADNSPKLVCYKAAQIGFSTMAILKALWLAKHKGLDIIYTMPSSSDMKDFVGGKINRLIAQNPVLLDYVKDKDSIEQKQVGDNIIYFRGTFTEKSAIAVSSDLNIHDEEDRSNQAVVQQYSSRLQHSKRKWEWHFSNPSVEGNGVSRYWARSDQKHWFIRCSECEKEQYLSWPDNINRNKRCFVCKFCAKELTNDERRKGRWVKKFKDKEYSGYWISLLMAPWITADEIMKYNETKSAEYFSNFVLGLPYVGEGNQVTPDIIYRNCTPEINTQERVVIGCDSGLKKHYVLGNKDGIFYAGITPTWDTIDSLLKKYERSVAVIDALPDLTEPRRLREKYPGRVFLCHYSQDRKTMQIIRWGEGKELGNVTVDRNRGLQMVIDDFANKKIPLQGTQDDWAEFQSHWATLYKITETDSLGMPVARWETSNGMDHFAHACLSGETLVTTEQGGVRIKDIKVGDYVLTRNGFERVSYSAMTNPDAEIVEVEFNNGSKITGTPTHRVWTENREWVELQNLTKNDILVGTWNNHSTEKYINSIKGSDTYGIVEECTEMYGNIITEKFRQVSMSIIKTTIPLITRLIIWNLKTHSSTWLNTLLQRLISYLSARSAELSISARTQAIIATAPLSAAPNSMVKSTTKWRGNVKSVKNNLSPISISGLSHVLNCVGVKVIAVGTKRMPVYGITVEGSHEYFANDILVANSLYWRTGMDRFRNDGGKIFTGETATFKSSPTIMPDRTISYTPRFVYSEQESEPDWRDI